jgi:hypothetical protein
LALEFKNFSPQAFERLVQTLGVSVLGPGTVVFGSGPDGGREATFTGEVPFPSSTDRWNGYIVIQAKCREVPRQNFEDANWLCEQLQKEFDAFLSRKRRKLPDYYLIVTNVRLSAVADVGGKDKVQKQLEKFAAAANLKSFAVWSADELSALLENAPEIRRAYSAWLTPSDVLSDLVQSLERPNLSRLLPLALARDIRNERDVRLRDAGQEADKSVFLDEVFIDLPLRLGQRTTNRELTYLDSAESRTRTNPLTSLRTIHEQEIQAGIVGTLIELSKNKFDPPSMSDFAVTQMPGERSPLPNRIVLLGGPGQGKSTLGQFIAQFFRAKTLGSHEPSRVNPQTLEVVERVLRRAEQEGLSAEAPCRFPIRVNLPSFADALKRAADAGAHLSLLGYITSALVREIDVELTGDDLRAWLGHCPSFIVLDGLDEVPPTANRTEVVRAIEAIWDDIHHVNGDCIVIVTTRPQGYSQDLDPHFWQHWELAPLSPNTALSFAKRLAELRVSDTEFRQTILEEMGRASQDAATHLLLTSPLQVTILFGIAYLKGTIPRDRWDLFEKYYSLLRDREAQKPNSIIREFRRQIDALHQEAGFLLHVAAESAGGANAFLTPAQFRELAERLLRDEDFDAEKVASISDELRRIATDRLVLLASRVQDHISFDVRSLQEYMAAARLTAASSIPLAQRLRAISSSAHWRHVMRIAASKIFSVADLGHFRSDVLEICHALDNGDYGDDGRKIKAGARLALDLLSDGVATSAPRFRKQLLRRALSLLDLNLHDSDFSLLHSFAGDTQDIFQEEILSRLAIPGSSAAYAAWRLLFSALDIDAKWAEPLLLQHWPEDNNLALAYLVNSDMSVSTAAVKQKILDTQRRAGPDATLRFSKALLDDEEEPGHASEWTDLLLLPPPLWPRGTDDGYEVTILRGKDHSALGTWLVPVNEYEADILHEIPEKPEWAAIRQAISFVLSPSKDSLAEALLALSHRPAILNALSAPWVFESLLTDGREGVSLAQLAKEAASGHFGDLSDWQNAEQRWRENGLTTDDFLTWNSGRYLGPKIAKVGAPYCLTLMLSANPPTQIEIKNFIEVLAHISPFKRVRLVEGILMMHRRDRPMSQIVQSGIVDLVFDTISKLGETQIDDWGLIDERLLSALVSADYKFWDDHRCRSLADRIGRRGDFQSWRLTSDGWVRAFNLDPALRGILPLIAWTSHRKNSKEILSSSALEFKSDDTTVLRVAIARLRVAHGKWSKADLIELADLLVQPLGQEYSYNLGELFGSSYFSSHTDHQELFNAVLSRAMYANPSLAAAMIRQLVSKVESAPSPLAAKIQRDELHLPSLPS